MTCKACSEAEPIYLAGCKGCEARALECLEDERGKEMNRDDVFRLVCQSARSDDSRILGCGIDDLTAFAKLVAAHEREECAKVCDQQAHEPECPERASYCAAAIRARGQS